MSIEKYCKNEYRFIRLQEIDSTNLFAKQLCDAGEKEKTVVLADRQTAGKGRLGRSFYSDADGIYMSVILRPNFSAENNLFVTAAAAVAVSRAIDNVCAVTTGIKWVNDIFLNGKKICGILTEASINTLTGKPNYTVLGIGINLSSGGKALPEDIKDIAGFIFKDNCLEQIKEKLIAEILDNFFLFYENLSKRTFMDEYRSRSVLIGKTVKCISGDNVFNATVLDINKDAGLVVVDNSGNTKILNAGEVSLKL